MESAFAALPEFNVGGGKFVTSPEVGAGDFVLVGEPGFELHLSGFEVGAIYNSGRLIFRNPSTDFRIVGAGLKVFFGDLT